ncbi:hypothetical protein DH20_09725 [Pantoea agglomerans]|nr:hypothetical protein [Pantoea agglomerans]
MPGAKSKNKMIYGKSVHSVHFWFLFIKFIRLGGEGFKAECTYCALRVITLTNHIKNQLKLVCMM